jgi:hypothetical protein
MRELGMFAKFWAPGEVKTRLAAAIGLEPAARLHRAFLQTLVERFAGAGDRRTLVFSPAHKRAEFQTLGAASWRLQPQPAGDLGRRMQVYFESAFAAGAERVVLIGSDSPTLPASYVESAFELLQGRPVVLGPAADGGYYLVGASRKPPPIFEGVAWSQPSVFAETAEKLAAARLEFATLPGWYDVDAVEDLRRLHDELSAGAEESAATLALRRAVDQALGTK